MGYGLCGHKKYRRRNCGPPCSVLTTQHTAASRGRVCSGHHSEQAAGQGPCHDTENRRGRWVGVPVSVPAEVGSGRERDVRKSRPLKKNCCCRFCIWCLGPNYHPTMALL